VPFEHTQIHQVTTYVLEQGLTDSDNLVPFCKRHHHLAHEGGWLLHLALDRTLTITKPDGTTIHARREQGPREVSTFDLSSDAWSQTAAIISATWALLRSLRMIRSRVGPRLPIGRPLILLIWR
jgi:hypothetical protein